MGDSKLVLTANSATKNTSTNCNSSKNVSICDTCCIPAFLLKWFKKKSSKKSLDLNGNESNIQTKSTVSNSFLLSSVTLKSSSEFDCNSSSTSLKDTNSLAVPKVITVVPSDARRPSILVNGTSRKSSLVPGGGINSSQFKKRVSFGNVLEQREYHPESDSEPDSDTEEKKDKQSHSKESNVDFYD